MRVTAMKFGMKEQLGTHLLFAAATVAIWSVSDCCHQPPPTPEPPAASAPARHRSLPTAVLETPTAACCYTGYHRHQYQRYLRQLYWSQSVCCCRHAAAALAAVVMMTSHTAFPLAAQRRTGCRLWRHRQSSARCSWARRMMTSRNHVLLGGGVRDWRDLWRHLVSLPGDDDVSAGAVQLYHVCQKLSSLLPVKHSQINRDFQLHVTYCTIMYTCLVAAGVKCMYMYMTHWWLAIIIYYIVDADTCF